MRTLKRCAAILVILAMLCSLACVLTLYAYPTHTHTAVGHDAHCVLCSVAANIGSLLQPADALTVSFVLLLGLVCLGVLSALQQAVKLRHAVTLVTLKTKLSW